MNNICVWESPVLRFPVAPLVNDGTAIFIFNIYPSFLTALNRQCQICTSHKKKKKNPSLQRVRFPHPCFYFHPDKPRDRGGKSVFMVLKYLCAAALNKAGCVPLHYPAGALSSPFKFENPRVKLRFTNLAEDQICGA